MRPSPRISRSVAAWTLTIAAAATGVVTASPAGAADTAERVAGNLRWDTAAAAAIATCDVSDGAGGDPDGDCLDAGETPVTTVTVANGLDFPDALAAAGLEAPILLTARDALPQATKDAITALGATKSFVVGGTSVISTAVTGELAELGATPTRLAGASRIATALDVAGQIGTASTVILADALDYPDALAGSSGAAEFGIPILLTTGSTLSAGVADAILDLGVRNVIILGGTAAVPASVESELVAYNVIRLGGTGRYATARLVAEYLSDPDSSRVLTGADGNPVMNDDRTVIARGDNFADALAGGPFTAITDGSLILSTPTVLHSEARAFLQSAAPDELALLGGTSALSDAVATSAVEASGGGALTVSGVAAEVTDTSGAPNTMDGIFQFNLDESSGATTVYDQTDATAFTVDNVSSSAGVFESNLTLGDTVTYDGTTFTLTNRTVTSGTVGDVDTLSHTFDIISAAGHTLATVDYDAAQYTTRLLDNAAVLATADIDDDISTGDSATLVDNDSDDTFDELRITNGSLVGSVVNSDPDDDGYDAQFQLNVTSTATTDCAAAMPIGIGDALATSTGALAEFFATATSANHAYTVGGAPADYDAGGADDFVDEITDCDRLTYSRKGDIESFALTNVTPPTPPVSEDDFSFDVLAATNSNIDTPPNIRFYGAIQGALDPLSIKTTDILPFTEADLTGLGDGDPLVVILDGVEVFFAELENHLANDKGIAPWGHTISFDDGATQNTLSVNTVSTSTKLVLDGIAGAADDSLADETVKPRIYGQELAPNVSLSTDYSVGQDGVKYFVNGVEKTEAQLEDFLHDIFNEGADEEGSDYIQVFVTDNVTQYRITTNNTLTV